MCAVAESSRILLAAPASLTSMNSKADKRSESTGFVVRLDKAKFWRITTSEIVGYQQTYWSQSAFFSLYSVTSREKKFISFIRLIRLALATSSFLSPVGDPPALADAPSGWCWSYFIWPRILLSLSTAAYLDIYPSISCLSSPSSVVSF